MVVKSYFILFRAICAGIGVVAFINKKAPPNKV